MKTLRILPVLLLILASCASVHVNSDYDKKADFTQFKTYAFFKNGIDKVEISDLDKKRILRSIDETMSTKGFTKSDSPDLLINFFTKSQDEVNINQYGAGWGYGYGWGWNPYFYGSTVHTNTEGTLYIDIIDAKKKEMIWQGQGVGYLTKDTERKDEVIKDFVSKILAQYPPQKK